MKKIKCKNCGIEVDAKNSRKTFCSQKCRKKYALKNKNDVEKTCPNCGKIFKTKNDKKIFCSIGCATSYRHKNPMFKEKHAAAMKKVRETEEYKYKQSKSQKIAQNKKETKIKRSNSMKNRWSEDKFKNKMIKARHDSKILNSQSFKEEEKIRNKEIANRESVKKAKSKFNKYYHNKSEIINSKREKMLSYWRDPKKLINRNDVNHGLYYDYELPSGRVIKLQGYEPQVLEQLLQTYHEEDILCEVKSINEEIGRIKYIFEDSEHTYYPDFYIKSTNTIIEVKSQWTFDKWKEKNLAKEQACLQQGFNFEFIIL